MMKTFLDLIIGNMKAGKSEEGIRRAKRYQKFCKVLFVSPGIDVRAKDGIVTSRSGLRFDTTIVEKLGELEALSEFNEAQVIILDEAQFFPDLFEHVVKWCDGKGYIVCSLDGDYKQEKFGQVWDLIPYADQVTKLTAICDLCADGTPAVCTISTEKLSGQVRVVDAESNVFIPVCRRHRKGV